MFEKLGFKKRPQQQDNSSLPVLTPVDLDDVAEEYAEAYDEQGFWSKCKRYARSIGRVGLEKAFTLYYATEHKNCTLAHKTAIYGALGYLLTPIDAIPDLTPFLGYTDDISLIGAALIAVASCIDESVKHKAKHRVSRLLGEGALEGVRECKVEDRNAVLSVWLTASIKAHDFVPPDFWAEQVSAMRDGYLPSAQVYVYEREGQVVGFYALRHNTLAALFVAPDYQSQGIGRELLEHAKAEQDSLTLSVFKANGAAIGFYLRQGFKVASEQVNPATEQPEFVMVWVAG
ncbi:putative N-acetyltransferase YjaB [Marinomonas aquimarina]|uniref:Putative N-acetyltransferase YjaB n=1 Tax=Marinomonas aquimarina TaxID=295068 RepID=A0A1A8TJS7_9GAMM|nr:N-acetyltransferase [Marinomonas aquimarina]SBS33731.1 putative N-acetyltransferase YjaB [Marinomonas aquimarina]